MSIKADIRTVAEYRDLSVRAVIESMRNNKRYLSRWVDRAAQHDRDTLYEYELREGDSTETIRAEDDDDAEQQLRDWVADGDYGQDKETAWVGAYFAGEDGEEHYVAITLEPPEPPCVAGEDHDWQSPYEIVGGCKENPGVEGNGGGVIITEVCVRCGCGRYTDTWAQNPETGEQGLESVRYAPHEFVDAVEPDCVDGEDHDWQSPHEIVGGIEENPGVWGDGGDVTIYEVCVRCGCGRHTHSSDDSVRFVADEVSINLLREAAVYAEDE